MPSAEVKTTVDEPVVTPVRVTVNMAVPAFSATVTSLMAKLVSSLVIDPAPIASVIVAPLALDNDIEKSSVDSTVVSSVMETVIVCDVTPAPKVNVPVFDV